MRRQIPALVLAVVTVCAIVACGGPVEESEPVPTTAALDDVQSWSRHFQCVYQDGNDPAIHRPYEPPTLQVHYHQWTPWWSDSPLVVLNGYAFYVYDPNWRVASVTVGATEPQHPEKPDVGYLPFTYGGTGSGVKYFDDLGRGVDKGKLRVDLKMVNKQGHLCWGEIEI